MNHFALSGLCSITGLPKMSGARYAANAGDSRKSLSKFNVTSRKHRK